MSLKKEDYVNYTAILKEELIPAMGCTETIAVAYAAATAAKVSSMDKAESTVHAFNARFILPP